VITYKPWSLPRYFSHVHPEFSTLWTAPLREHERKGLVWEPSTGYSHHE